MIEKNTLYEKEPKGLIEYAKRLSRHCHGMGVEDTLVYDIENKRPDLDTVKKIKDLGMMLHVWTFKDDQLPFGAKTPLVISVLVSKPTKLDKMSLN